MSASALEELRQRATLKVPEAAQLLGISPRHAYEGVRKGEIPSIRIGARVLVPTVPLLRLLGIEEGDTTTVTPLSDTEERAVPRAVALGDLSEESE